ncbi:MAG: hypothetical protein LQ343_004666 [Gyalolechia ehrenbergii]|nr:MAG: hypothetical protein LQ343_004666 [Gyalolechia ehrenbergii]
MSLPISSLGSIPTCYATVSIGTPDTPLDQKLEAIAGAGFQGIELGFPDLLSFASKRQNEQVQPQDFDTLCDVGREVKQLVENKGLKIVMLQPFSNFEGWEGGSEGREDAFRRAKGWIRIMQAVGTDMLQVGSTDSPHALGSFDYLASDLRQLADLLAPHNFRLAYENWCWATHAPDWKDVWEIVRKVDRPNVGLCLDTFQTAGGEWADPTTDSGLIEREGGKEALESQFKTSLEILARTIPKEKIYILQISDAYKPRTPLDSNPDESGLRPRGRWSSCLRPVPFDGGYLPVVDVTQAVLKTGFRSWFSMEVFDGGPDGSDQDWKDLKGYAKQAMASHNRLLQEAANS